LTYFPLAALTVGLLTQITVKPALAVTFVSGSSCSAAFYNSTTCRGAFNPAVNTTVALPPNGILDYSTITIPYGVSVSFTKNAANTPVIIRTSGDVKIEGSIYVGALTSATNSGTAGDGNLGDDGQPGTGGPGGFDGGYGGLSPLFGGASYKTGGAGKGPGGGQAGSGNYGSYNYTASGGGGGFGAAGGASSWGGPGGAAYGQSSLLPLIGGSGGGGGQSGPSYNGAGGGGGGGAILIASDTTIIVGKTGQNGAGRIFANGGGGGTAGNSSGNGGGGGGGSGGAIRIVANTLSRIQDGYLQAVGGGGNYGYPWSGGDGAAGIIRLEANTITGWTTSNSAPAYSFGLPGHVLVPNNPTLSIVSVTANATTLNVPANPTGNADLTFPTGTTSATVNLSATGIPTGATADVYVIPANGVLRTKVLSAAFSAPDVNGVSTATATVTLSPGNNVLQAAVTYTVTELVAMNLPRFNGEYVAKIRVEGGMDGKSKVTYITASGKEYPADKAKV